MQTRPLTPWRKGDRFAAAHMNEVWGRQRSQNPSVTRGNLRQMPNGMSIDIPLEFIPSGGYPGVIWNAGPGGEADFTNEQYWVWLSYTIADKWGLPVDTDKDYARTGTDLSNVIVPATNWSERQPGGPSGSGTHVLRVGTPVLLLPVFGRRSVATDTTASQRFIFYNEDVGVGQYPGQVLVTEAAHTRQWSFITAVPSLT